MTDMDKTVIGVRKEWYAPARNERTSKKGRGHAH